MKLLTCTAALVSFVFGLLGAAAPNPILAQMYPQPYPQPPIMAPYTPGFNLGVFYVNAGVKFRNLQTVRTKIEPHSVQQLLEPGTVPFGPNTAGTILYPYDAAAALPTANPLDPPNVSGIWPYDDGNIDPRNPGDEANDTSFSPPALALGHYNVPPSSVGFFTVSTPLVQTDNNGGIYSETKSVTLSRRIDGSLGEAPSRGFTATSGHETTIAFTDKIWTPWLEFGYRASSYFDCIFGVSGFNNSNVFQRGYLVQAQLYRRTFKDTYLFESSNSLGVWMGNFSSRILSTATNPDPTKYYVIYPAGRAGGLNLPTRAFYFLPDPTVAAVPAEEIIYNRIDFTAIEFKSGGRSWFPLYGLGEIGTSLGVLVTPMPVTIVNSSRVVALADSADAGVTAGDTLLNIADKHEEFWFWRNLGLFVGLDLRLSMGRFFAQSAVEYDWYPVDNEYKDFPGITNTINIGGVNATFTAGAFF